MEEHEQAILDWSHFIHYNNMDINIIIFFSVLIVYINDK